MGWVWRDEADDANRSSAADGGDFCSTRKVVRSQCKTEEVEPGKFVRRCEKTQEILRDCIGKPVEVLQSNKEYTEEDVTDQVLNRSSVPRQFEDGPFSFPGLRSDIESIERQFSEGIKHFFDTAEEMQNSFLDIFREHSSSPSARRGIPIEGRPQVEEANESKPKGPDSSGHIDLSGLAKDV